MQDKAGLLAILSLGQFWIILAPLDLNPQLIKPSSTVNKYLSILRFEINTCLFSARIMLQSSVTVEGKTHKKKLKRVHVK